MPNTRIPQIGVIVPTRNRSDFVKRTLAWYWPWREDITIHLGDYPALNEMQAAYAAALESTEPYLAFHGDDDLMIPWVLRMMAHCLEALGAAAPGSIRASAVLFTTKGDGPWGKLEATRKHPDQLFRLYRRDVLLRGLDLVQHMPVAGQRTIFGSAWADDDIRAVTFYNYVNAHGIVDVDGCIHLFRQGHHRRTKMLAKPKREALRTRFGRLFPRTQYAKQRFDYWRHGRGGLTLPELRDPRSPYYEAAGAVERFLRLEER